MGMGMSLGLWFQLFLKNRYKIKSSNFPVVFTTTFFTFLNSLAGILEKIFYHKSVEETEIVAPPIFIIGYWRSGTTHLQNLLSQDGRFTFPTTYTCVFPGHFLLSERLLKKLLERAIPRTRPMDDMRLSLDSPQEDEIALAFLSGFSPYLDFAFPNEIPKYRRFLDFKDATIKEQQIFKKTMINFVKKHTYRCRKQVILKSPAHSYRIRLLIQAFPGAKFIHIHRNPVDVFFSAVRTFTIQKNTFGLTKPDNSKLEQQVIEDMLLCYKRIQEDKRLLAPNQFLEIRFENLEQHPLIELEKVYRMLNLGDFELVKPRFEDFLISISYYRKYVYDISEDKKEELNKIFHDIIKKYEY